VADEKEQVRISLSVKGQPERIDEDDPVAYSMGSPPAEDLGEEIPFSDLLPPEGRPGSAEEEVPDLPPEYPTDPMRQSGWGLPPEYPPPPMRPRDLVGSHSAWLGKVLVVHSGDEDAATGAAQTVQVERIWSYYGTNNVPTAFTVPAQGAAPSWRCHRMAIPRQARPGGVSRGGGRHRACPGRDFRSVLLHER